MRVSLTLVALLATVGCGDASSVGAAESADVSPAVQALVDKSLESEHWSEDDRVVCGGYRASPAERVVGEDYRVRSSMLFEGRQGDILVMRFCNTISRLNGLPFFDQRGECSKSHVMIVGEAGLTEIVCYSFFAAGDFNGGGIEETEVDVYMKHIGNVDYLESGQ